MAQRIDSLVGREAELDALARTLGIGRGGAGGRHVVLGGDAGVGKTRLLTELRDRAFADGWLVHAGHCLDFGDSAEPYLPFSEILDRLAGTVPDVVARVAEAHPALLRLSAAARALGGAVPPEALDRGNLFAAVHALLEATAEEAPALVAVEDAHWADRSTRDLLTFLFARPFSGPVAIVTSYRADDLHRRHPLRSQLAGWSRLPRVERVVLEPLPPAAVRRLARTLDADLTDAEIEAVVARADGNAFFAEELVAAASGSSGVVPADLADLLLVRLDRLDEPARDGGRTASAAGREVSEELLVAVAGLDQPELEAALRQAIEMSILVVRRDGYYAFRHALLRDAVYDDLLPGQRTRMHQRYVAALRRGLTTGTAAGLARHARLAGDRETALRAGIRAGDVAAAAGGPDEAAQHYQQAITLMSDAPDRDTGELVDLVVKAAEAMIAAGRADHAQRLARQLRARLPEDAPGLWRAQLITTDLEAGFAYVDGRDDLPLSEAAVAALPDDAPPLVRARVLAAHTRMLMIHRRHEEAERSGREALDLAERFERPALAADLAVTLAAPWGRPVEERVPGLVDAVERAAGAGALDAELRGRLQLAIMHHHLGDLEQGHRWASSGHELALARGVPWAPYAFDARVHLMWNLLVRGRIDEALRLADVPGAPPVLAAWITASRLLAEQARGHDVGAAARALRPFWTQEVATAIESVPVEMIAAGRCGDAAGVVEAYDAGTSAVAAVWGAAFDARVRFAAVAVGQLASLLPALTAAERSAAMRQLERIAREGLEAPAQEQGLEGRAWRLRLRAETSRARWLAGADAPAQTELVGAWRETETAFDLLGHVHELAAVRVTLAAVLRSTGDPTAARAVADLARDAAQRLGARPLLDELRRSPSPAHAELLTPRETEILALVAEGRSNGEIGKRLFISTKTVSVHVSNILGKLRASGRTEAAAVARRRGLLVD